MNRVNEILNKDGVIAFVTDTVWGIGCLPTSEKAVQRIYEIKNREAKKPLILMSDDLYPLLHYVNQPIEKLPCPAFPTGRGSCIVFTPPAYRMRWRPVPEAPGRRIVPLPRCLRWTGTKA